MKEVLFFAKQVPAIGVAELSLRNFLNADALASWPHGTEQIFRAISAGGMKL